MTTYWFLRCHAQRRSAVRRVLISCLLHRSLPSLDCNRTSASKGKVELAAGREQQKLRAIACAVAKPTYRNGAKGCEPVQRDKNLEGGRE